MISDLMSVVLFVCLCSFVFDSVHDNFHVSGRTEG